MTDATRLAEIGARCELATEGPWAAQEFPCMDYYSVTGPDGLFAEEVVCHDRAEERIIVRRPDADFIAHAREDVPWLLEFAARLTDELLGRLAVMREALVTIRGQSCVMGTEWGDSAIHKIAVSALASDAGKPEVVARIREGSGGVTEAPEKGGGE